MEIRKMEIPKELEKFTDKDLPDEAFADDVNRLLPLDTEGNVIEAFEVIQNIPYKLYETAEKIYILDRLCQAASNFELDVEELVAQISLGGEVMIDKNSPEFQEAVKAEAKVLADKLMEDFADKDKKAAAMQELKNQIGQLSEEKEGLFKEIETVKAEKEKAEQDFAEYKEGVEKAARIRERVDALKSVGLELEDWTETEEAVAEMSEKVFEVYKTQLSEAIKHGMKEEEMKKMEEEKKKKKEKEAKASTDIVEESKKEGDLPNGKAEASEDEFPAFSKFLEADYGKNYKEE